MEFSSYRVRVRGLICLAMAAWNTGFSCEQSSFFLWNRVWFSWALYWDCTTRAEAVRYSLRIFSSSWPSQSRPRTSCRSHASSQGDKGRPGENRHVSLRSNYRMKEHPRPNMSACMGTVWPTRIEFAYPVAGSFREIISLSFTRATKMSIFSWM